MPIYGYGCEHCSSEFELVCSVKEHRRVVECPKCGHNAMQVITAPIVIIPSHMSATGVSSYESPIDGRLITSQRARREDLARNNCIEYDPGMRQDTDRRVIEDEKKLDAAVDETFDRALSEMPAVKKERLEAEMSAGMTAEVARI